MKTFARAFAVASAIFLLAACGNSSGPGGSVASTTGGGAAGTSTGGTSGGTGTTTGPTATSIGHVFVVILENKDYSETFGSGTAAPYLASTLTAQGALVEGYYGTGHVSLDNYISMISGQGPNETTQTDCEFYLDFAPSTAAPNATLGNQAAGQGCVFPTGVPNVTDQMKAKSVTWKGYMEDMGNDPSRESATCGHPTLNMQDGTQSAAATDGYATRHDPFMYFHSIIDDAAYCNAHVVNLKALDADLASADTTPQFVFITPNLCSDGHDANPCTNTDASGANKGGLDGINNFLTIYAPKIMNSPAFQKDGLLIVTFDESDYTKNMDSSACCGETSVNVAMAGISGSGGGKVGAVLISQFIKPGTVVDPTKYMFNHYSMLRSVEDIFGLNYLGYAGATSQASFGPEVFTAQMPVFPAKQ